MFYGVVAEVATLHAKWGDYTSLFGRQNRIDLLNNAAPELFSRLQYTLLDDAMLHLARLTDKAATGKKANLSIRGVVQRLPDWEEFQDQLAEPIQAMDDKAAACRDWRNRRIAHNDYLLSVGAAIKPLELASRASIRGAIDAATSVVNAISVRYLAADMGFDFDEAPATDLIYVLYDGVRAAEERRARLTAGEYVDPNAFPPRDL